MYDHELKTKSEYWYEVCSGLKNFELRRNDRDFKVGQILRLKNVETGDYCYRAISYILSDVPEYGLEKGFVILGLA